MTPEIFGQCVCVGGHTDTTPPSLVRRTERNGLKHRRMGEARRGTDKKARKIHKEVERSAGEGRKRPGELTPKGGVLLRGVQDWVSRGLEWPARPWALPARRGARGSSRLPRDPANYSLAAPPEAASGGGGGGGGPGLARCSESRLDGRPFPTRLGAERPYLGRRWKARSRGFARRTAARGPRLSPETRHRLRRRFALGGSATAAARAVYTVRPLTPPPPPSLQPRAAADSAAATSSAAA